MEDLSVKREKFEIKLAQEERADLQELFGNSNPVHLEIGSGRGEFLICKVEENPQINFLALELKERRIKTILRKLDPEIHSNVKICRLYVDSNVIKSIDPGSFETIYIIHPDPWPKRKHYKNRLIQTDFISILCQLLIPKGEIFISTDHPDYAIWIIDHFNDRKDFISYYKNKFSRARPDGHVETHFEKKKREEGFPPFYMKFIKVADEHLE
jgi:tRNA (guanine-N7-)-methyltransferase